ncbi:MAG: NPCBM/NEW2 domain-containing protein [Fimbriimonadaceae bacterium]|nr:NPCBM/NEW2 domain-containing protein [Fimbriimonadaceae bacterium]QOJ12479.1 MAG: NPCBM/NEW2 domain-containing protein [Chthonomonadaceae bacterium]
MPLTSLKPVTDNGYLQATEESFSMSGRIFEFGFRNHMISRNEAFIVFDLDRSYRTLRLEVGSYDEYDSWYDGYNHVMSISADGDLRKSESWKARPKPELVSIDVSGVKSLAISLSPGLALGEPMLEK